MAGLDEMQKLVAAVEAHLADDAERLARVKAKLEKRQANHTRYLEFQQLEKDATTVKQLLALADRVQTELEDPFYAAKLIESAEKLLDDTGGSYQFSRYKPILVAIDRNLDDADWLGRLLDRAAENATDFIAFKDLVVTAAQMKHRELGVSKARAYLAARESALASNASVYDLAKLAEASYAATQDTTEAGRLLEAARAQARDHFALSHIGRLYAGMGNAAKADELYAAAAASCSSGDECIQFIDRLKGFALPAETLKKWYAECGNHLSKPADKLRWAEGIADALNDKTWASEAYTQLAGQFANDARFDLSRRSRADLNYFGATRRH